MTDKIQKGIYRFDFRNEESDKWCIPCKLVEVDAPEEIEISSHLYEGSHEQIKRLVLYGKESKESLYLICIHYGPKRHEKLVWDGNDTQIGITGKKISTEKFSSTINRELFEEIGLIVKDEADKSHLSKYCGTISGKYKHMPQKFTNYFYEFKCESIKEPENKYYKFSNKYEKFGNTRISVCIYDTYENLKELLSKVYVRLNTRDAINIAGIDLIRLDHIEKMHNLVKDMKKKYIASNFNDSKKIRTVTYKF